MPEFKPHNYRRGDNVDHQKLNETDEAIARNQIVSGPNMRVSKSIQGTSFESDSDSVVVVGYALVITVACLPCTGDSPNFQFGKGRGELLNVFSDGTTTTTGTIVDVYNTLPEGIPARLLVVQAKTIGPLIVVDVAPCSES